MINDGRPASQSDFNDNVVRKSLKMYLINLLKVNKSNVVSQGEMQILNTTQKTIVTALIDELNFFLFKKNVITKLIEADIQQEVFGDELRRVLEYSGRKVEKWTTYEAIVDGKKVFIRPGSKKPKGWQITFRGRKEGSFIDCLQKGDGYLLVSRGSMPLIPLSEVKKVIGDESAYNQDTIDIWIVFKEDGIILSYKKTALTLVILNWSNRTIVRKGSGKITAPEIIILSNLIVLFAFIIRGLTGFGSGLLMVPIMVLFLDMKLVVAVSAIFAMLCGYLLLATFQTRKWIRKDVLPMLIGGAIIGTVVGTYMLASYKSDILKKALGIFIMAYALKMLFWNKEIKGKPKNYIWITAGFFGGLFGGLFSTGDPPVIVYLDSIINDKRVFRATLVFYFLVTNTWQCGVYLYKGLINMDVIKFTLYLMPAFIMGNLIGSFLHVKINDVLFNRIIAIVLLVTGASNLF